MSPPEKVPELLDSALPRALPSDVEVAIALHKIKWELAAINKKLETAANNDERFKVMETHFTSVKWFAAAACVAALGALFTVVATKMSSHISDPPTLQGR